MPQHNSPLSLVKARMRQYMMARRRYGTMGFSSLALVTADDPRHAALHATALNATRMLADYMEAQQEVRETNCE